jgi:hypothetical protein
MKMWYKTCSHHTNYHCSHPVGMMDTQKSLCGVNDLFSSTKHIRLGVITTDGCKKAQRTLLPSLVTKRGMDGCKFSHTVHALVQMTWHHTVALMFCPARW